MTSKTQSIPFCGRGGYMEITDSPMKRVRLTGCRVKTSLDQYAEPGTEVLLESDLADRLIEARTAVLVQRSVKIEARV